MSRIHSLESSQLNGLIGRLAQIDATLTALRQQMESLKEIQRQGLETHDHCSVEYLTQSSLWIDSVDRSMALVRDSIGTCQAERQEAHAKVLEQRTRVRGLELLIEQLRFEFEADVQTQQMLLADENALKNYARG